MGSLNCFPYFEHLYNTQDITRTPRPEDAQSLCLCIEYLMIRTNMDGFEIDLDYGTLCDLIMCIYVHTLCTYIYYTIKESWMKYNIHICTFSLISTHIKGWGEGVAGRRTRRIA